LKTLQNEIEKKSAIRVCIIYTLYQHEHLALEPLGAARQVRDAGVIAVQPAVASRLLLVVRLPVLDLPVLIYL
jgi:hypothetical protein